MSRADQMEAVYELFGGLATSLAAPVSAGATTVSVNASIPSGDAIEIDVAGSAPEDNKVVGVSGTGPYTLTLAAPIAANHNAGAIVSTYQSACNVNGITTVVRGELLDFPDKLLPVMIITIPEVKEYRSGGTSSIRGMAQKKGVDYVIRLGIGGLYNGKNNFGDQGATILKDFYSLLDALGAVIRQNKVLATLNYPQGASVRFGEDSTWQENHERIENTIKAVARVETVSTELVNA